MSRAKVGELVARSTTEVAGSTLDVARRQAVGLDTLIMRFVDRVPVLAVGAKSQEGQPRARAASFH